MRTKLICVYLSVLGLAYVAENPYKQYYRYSGIIRIAVSPELSITKLDIFARTTKKKKKPREAAIHRHLIVIREP